MQKEAEIAIIVKNQDTSLENAHREEEKNPKTLNKKDDRIHLKKRENEENQFQGVAIERKREEGEVLHLPLLTVQVVLIHLVDTDIENKRRDIPSNQNEVLVGNLPKKLVSVAKVHRVLRIDMHEISLFFKMLINHNL